MVRFVVFFALLPLITGYSFPKLPSGKSLKADHSGCSSALPDDLASTRRSFLVTATSTTAAATFLPMVSYATGNEKVEFASERYVPRIKAGAKAYKKDLYKAVGSGNMADLGAVVAEPRKVRGWRLCKRFFVALSSAIRHFTSLTPSIAPHRPPENEGGQGQG